MTPNEAREAAGRVVMRAADAGVFVDTNVIYADGIDSIECPRCCVDEIVDIYRRAGLSPQAMFIGPH